MNAIGRWGLTLVLGGLGLAKLWAGHSEAYFLPAWAYYGSALLESGFALMLWGRFRIQGLMAVAGFAMISALFHWFTTAGADCGCFAGLVESSRALGLLVSGLLGLVSGSLLWRAMEEPRLPA